ncbi:MAG: nicotinate-nucleotide diphosphorylase (carboxylating), partial [Nitrospinaceae bacterium]
MIRPPTQEQIQRLIAAALAEDVGSGDITTANVLQGDPVAAADMTAKEPLVLCGLEIARAVFLHLDPGARFDDLPFADGDAVAAGSVVFRVRARTRALLEGER